MRSNTVGPHVDAGDDRKAVSGGKRRRQHGGGGFKHAGGEWQCDRSIREPLRYLRGPVNKTACFSAGEPDGGSADDVRQGGVGGLLTRTRIPMMGKR